MYAERRPWINIFGLNRALVSSAAPGLAPVPARAGTRVSRSAARDFAAGARISRSTPAGRSNPRKKSSEGITLAGSLTDSGFGGFRFLTRSR